MKPAVLLIGNFLSSTLGVRSVSEDLADKLKENGWNVIMASSHPGRLRRLLEMIAATLRDRNVYRVANVEVFSGPAFIWAEIVCAILRSLKKPYILTLHGGNLPAFAERHDRRVRRLLNSAAAVTTPSNYLLEALKDLRSDILLISNPINLEAYRFRLRERIEPNLIWLRAFHKIYNPDLATRTLSRLLPDFPQARLTMIGPDKGDGSAQRTTQSAVDLSVIDRVRFAGSVAKSEVPRTLNDGDLFLNTTNVDNAPVSVLEAMACGLCVISTNVGGIPYLLDHERDAILVPPDDPQAMAAAVRRLLDDSQLAARLSASARKKVELMDWSVVLPRWEELFMRVARQ